MGGTYPFWGLPNKLNDLSKNDFCSYGLQCPKESGILKKRPWRNRNKSARMWDREELLVWEPKCWLGEQYQRARGICPEAEEMNNGTEFYRRRSFRIVLKTLSFLTSPAPMPSFPPQSHCFNQFFLSWPPEGLYPIPLFTSNIIYAIKYQLLKLNEGEKIANIKMKTLMGLKCRDVEERLQYAKAKGKQGSIMVWYLYGKGQGRGFWGACRNLGGRNVSYRK